MIDLVRSTGIQSHDLCCLVASSHNHWTRTLAKALDGHKIKRTLSVARPL